MMLIWADGKQMDLAPLPTFKEAQEMVGGYIEPIHLHDGSMLLVNEDGHNLGLPYNPQASALYGGTIVGAAIHGTRAEMRRIGAY